jgi:hypothetical protein
LVTIFSKHSKLYFQNFDYYTFKTLVTILWKLAKLWLLYIQNFGYYTIKIF